MPLVPEAAGDISHLAAFDRGLSMAVLGFSLRPMQALECFDSLLSFAKDVKSLGVSSLHVETNVKSPDYQFNGTSSGKDVAPLISAFRSQLEEFGFIEVSNARVDITCAPEPIRVRYKIDPSGLYATILVHPKRSEDNPFAGGSPVSQVLTALHKHFTFMPKPLLAEEAIDDREKAALAAREVAMGALESNATELQKLVAQQIAANQDHVRQIQTDLNKEYLQRQNELDEKHNDKLKAIEQREEALRNRQEEFDLRDNTVVRRDLLKEIRTLIKTYEVARISKHTSRKRWVTHAICWTVMLAAGGLVAFFALSLLGESDPHWRKYIPFTAGTMIFASTLVYYLRWHDQWFREHTSAEFQNRKFNADILRASWIAELHFEWDSKKEGEFPHDLITSFTRGLFSESHVAQSKYHPLDQLTSLVPDIAKLKVNKSGLTISTRESKEAQ